MKLVLKIAAGILLAYGIMTAGGLAVAAYTVHLAEKEFQKLHAKQEAEELEKLRQLEMAKQAKAARQRQVEAQTKRRNQQISARQRTERELDKAFLAQYEPPLTCVSPQSDNRWVECVDIQRKAKAEYLEQQALLNAPLTNVPVQGGRQ